MASDFFELPQSIRESDEAAQLGRRTYTRAENAQLYAAHRRGDYARRELEWRRQEYDICRAMREGRVLGGVSLFSKSSRDLM
jgi:hypothetical protein